MRTQTDTTTAEWQKYYADLKEHEDYMQSIKPQPETFEAPDLYRMALSEWQMAGFCDAPNKPGYYRANND